MNDHLNDLQIRSSLMEKQKMIRGLGIVLKTVGVSIATVTPQVSGPFVDNLIDCSQKHSRSWQPYKAHYRWKACRT